ncbi:hypothetical protein LDENG_00181720, partial [Lucifuga dentata]
MRFVHRVSGLTLRDRVRSSDIQEGLRVEPLLLHIKRRQLRWFRHLVRMDSGRSLGRSSRHVQLGRGPREDPGHAGG